MLLSFFLTFFLEIVTVTATWNPGICNQGCEALLAKSLYNNMAIQNIEMTRGRVVMFWRPNAPFSYQALKRNFQAVGVGLNLTPFELRVRGTVDVIGRSVILTSIGDNTRFGLFSLPPQSSTLYVSRGTLYNKEIQGELLDQLRWAQRNQQIVEIIGGLYLPESPPYKLEIHKISYPNANR